MGPWARRSTHTCSPLLFERSGVHLAKRCPARSTVRDVLDLHIALCAYSDGRDAHRQARAGQFVHVRPGTSFEPLLRRPYSFNRIRRQEGEIELIVRPLGPGGEWIASRRPGDLLDLLGPLGTAFVIHRSARNLLLVA